ncbi:MAG: cytochrome c3 family protein [Myxococcaceae bacterium]
MRASTETQLCIFCHTPHNAISQKLLWNHSASTATNDGWVATQKTTKGTTLPVNINLAAGPSAKCLSCHDGTVVVGAVGNIGGGVVGIIATTQAMGAGYMVGPDLSNDHPVGIPYAGRTYTLTGTAVTSSASQTDPYQYFPDTGTGCTGSTPFCVNTTNGLKLPLYNTSTTAADRGVECGSCHEPHGTGNSYFLRVTKNGSAICLSCHNK